jgi:hypothetical protein
MSDPTIVDAYAADLTRALHLLDEVTRLIKPPAADSIRAATNDDWYTSGSLIRISDDHRRAAHRINQAAGFIDQVRAETRRVQDRMTERRYPHA